MTGQPLPPAAQLVQNALADRGFSFRVVELPGSTRTAKEAAVAVGCDVAQIAKSLIFRGKTSGDPLLVIASGANRVDEKRLRDLAGEPIGKADADFVRNRTGFAIGGVPPLGHAEPIRTWIDEDLLHHNVIWAAAGTHNSLFELDPGDLPEMTDGEVARVRRA